MVRPPYNLLHIAVTVNQLFSISYKTNQIETVLMIPGHFPGSPPLTQLTTRQGDLHVSVGDDEGLRADAGSTKNAAQPRG